MEALQLVRLHRGLIGVQVLERILGAVMVRIVVAGRGKSFWPISSTVVHNLFL